MAFISDLIQYTLREDLSNVHASSLWLELPRKNKKNILICNIYRQWGDRTIDPQKERLETIITAIKSAKAEDKEIMLIGDIQSRPIQTRIYHSNERCRISAILRHGRKLFQQKYLIFLQK